MNRFIRGLAPLAVLAMAVLTASAASAQATRTWVSGVGDDANPCSRTAPCKTFPGAISKTAANGSINVLDPGGFGAVTITKAMTISSEGFEGGIVIASGNGVNVSAGANDIVTLRGLDIDCSTSTTSNGIKFNTGAALHVQKTTIKRCIGTGSGILFAPNAAAKLDLRDVVITDNGTGVLIQPVAGGSAKFVLDHVTMFNNTSHGLALNGTGSTSGINGSMVDSVSSGNVGDGVNALTPGGGAPVNLIINRSTLEGNLDGLKVDGSGVQVFFGDTVITANALNGIVSANSGFMFSYKNNDIDRNSGNETPTGTAVQK